MIRHVFTLIWNRKRANALIMLELLVTFLILFALIGFSLNLYRLYNKPLGFNVADTWSLTVETGGAWRDEDGATFRQVLAVTQQLEGVIAAELMHDMVFDPGGSAMSMSLGNWKDSDVDVTVVSRDFPETVGMRLLEGRWFGPEDDTANPGEVETIVPVLVNKALSDAAGGDVVGMMISETGRQQRIVGVFEDFRQHGQFSSIRPMMMQRVRVDGSYYEAPGIVLFLEPGVPAEFEERLLDALQRTAPGWDFDVYTWEALQENHFKLYTIPLMIISGLVLFLLAMVGFGMLGVLWQNVIRRTPEMGVRRAMGASASAVRLQVVLELLAVALVALVPGLVLVVQLPLSGILVALDWQLFVPAAMLSAMLLLGLCVLFALYPSYQATRQDPVAALRYE
jgi:putative ABC transport system permease protein